MTSTHERIQAVTEFGFTDRQARFLVLVMRHGARVRPRARPRGRSRLGSGWPSSVLDARAAACQIAGRCAARKRT